MRHIIRITIKCTVYQNSLVFVYNEYFCLSTAINLRNDSFIILFNVLAFSFSSIFYFFYSHFSFDAQYLCKRYFNTLQFALNFELLQYSNKSVGGKY